MTLIKPEVNLLHNSVETSNLRLVGLVGSIKSPPPPKYAPKPTCHQDLKGGLKGRSGDKLVASPTTQDGLQS